MAATSFTIWSSNLGEVCVEELEHLFGFDLILSESDHAGVYRPKRIITNNRQLSRNERYTAKAWMRAWQAREWPQIILAESKLSLAP
jgi:hypothetical protein